MTAIRFALEKSIFEPSDERLVKAIHVSQLEKKKKTYFLCLSVSKDKSGFISTVKKLDKDNYKKKRTWGLQDLRLVDGKDGKRDTADLDLQFEKMYKWVASTPLERNMFIANLWMLCSQHLHRQQPQFVNIPAEFLDGGGQTAETRAAMSPVSELVVEADSYQALTAQEEEDLLRMMSEHETAVSNAEAFAEQLSQELSGLDGANIQSIMASEQQVAALMSVIQRAVDEISAVEERLEQYDQALVTVRQSLREMGREKSKMEVTQRNHHQLLQTLEGMLPDLPTKDRQVLSDPDLTTAVGLKDACQAAQSLLRLSATSVDPQLQQMAAVAEQKKLFEKLKARFSQAVYRQMNNFFVHMGNDGVPAEDSLQLPSHSSQHLKLQPYSELMHWTKAVDNRGYETLKTVYGQSLSKRYEREVKALFAEARSRVGAIKKDPMDSPGGTATMSRMSSQLRQLQAKPAGAQHGAVLLGSEREAWTTLDSSDRLRFDDVLEQLLKGLEPSCLEEQNFCVGFFKLGQDGAQSQSSQPDSLADGALGRHDEVRSLMRELFGSLETELNSFLAQHERIDSFCVMHILVRLSEHVTSTQDSGSFLHQTLAAALVASKQNLDRLMRSQIESVETCPPPRRSKCAILPFVSNFQELAAISESVFRDSSRRADLDRWYSRVIRAVIDQVTTVGGQHQKTPLEVVQMENFHHLHALLMRLKLAGLEAEKREVKAKYTDALRAYVTRYFGQPLIKLNQFFGGVQSKVAQGVRESEMGYQLAFSKQELRKVIKEYPGKEVKKGLETLYRKVEKHLCEEENLLQVVWRAMQEEFITQYKSIEEMIQRCYPGAMITLEFTIDDLLRFFSEIARSH
ncbi:exocyst complex component 1-like [Pollicipes pollicipes]|uniref:exocyst complex component 1-like n=1 Tax=Pollicipes pollicipes TaxID=41117 RepID=UPI001884D81F|nr:exocyst complex component 1-like [Pollicipes pollicipes]XP_037075508.1 exocyst complex component 1-like [Pollicipes pollicipes]